MEIKTMEIKGMEFKPTRVDLAIDNRIALLENCGEAKQEGALEYLETLMKKEFPLKSAIENRSDMRLGEEKTSNGGFALVYRFANDERELAVKVTSFRKSQYYTGGLYNTPLNMENWEKNRDVFTREARVIACDGYAAKPKAVGAPYLFELMLGEDVYDYVLCIPMETYEPFTGVGNEKEAVKLAKQVLSALTKIHETYVHRDIKPDNIMMDGERYVLVDWGFAKEWGQKHTMVSEGAGAVADDDTKSAVTDKARLVNSGRYTCPYKGKDGNLPTYEEEVKGDLYSLGIVLAEMVYGRALTSETKDYLDICLETIEEFDRNVCSSKFKEFLLKAIREDGFSTATEMLKALGDLSAVTSGIFSDQEEETEVLALNPLNTTLAAAGVSLVSWFVSGLGAGAMPEEMNSNIPAVGICLLLFFGIGWLCQRMEFTAPKRELRMVGLIWLLSVGAFAAVVCREQQDLPVLIPLLAAGVSTLIYFVMQKGFDALSQKIGVTGGRGLSWALFGAVVGASYGISAVAVPAVQVGKPEMLWAWDLLFPFLVYGVIGATLFFVLFAGRELWKISHGKF